MAEVGEHVAGTPGQILRCLNVNERAFSVFATPSKRDWDVRNEVGPGVFWAFCVGLWLLGVVLAWRRARTTEVAA
jgi:hypothetical protein